MRWFASKPAAWSLLGATIYALAWWLAVAGVLGYRPAAEPADQFTIVSFHADYRISGSATGVLQVVETVVVDFPAGQGLHGFDRALPTTRAGRSLPVSDVSATVDEQWAEVAMDRTPVRARATIGDPNVSMSGRHTYRLSYVYHDVITGPDWDQDFTWAITGTEWPQAIESVTATITLDSGLASDLTENSRCFVGSPQSTGGCSVQRTDTANGGVTLRVGGVSVGPHQSPTIVIELRSDTVRVPLAAAAWAWLMLVWLVVGSLAVAALVSLRRAAARVRFGNKGGDRVTPRFVPPPDLPPMVAGGLVGFPRRGVVAELLRAASEGRLTLSGGGDSDAPLTAELVSWPDHWSAASQRALHAALGSRDPGTTVVVADQIDAVPETTLTELVDADVELGLISPAGGADHRRRLKNWLLAAGALLIPALIGSGLALDLPLSWVLIATVVLVLSLATHVGILFGWNHFTRAGRTAWRHLNGLIRFLTVSEKKRSQIVRRDRAPIDPDQRRSIFEGLVPYAVALGVEDRWHEAAGPELADEISWLPEGAMRDRDWGAELDHAGGR